MQNRPQLKFFLIMMAIIFVVTFSILYAFGFVPESLKFVDNNSNNQSDDSKNNSNDNSSTSDDDNNSDNDSKNNFSKNIPDRVIISKIGINAKINHPSSTNVSVLDEALKLGAVYYPGSGTIEDGNVFIFGHSTNWQVVQNQAYKAFNGLEKLVKGDEIILESNGEKYLYKVLSVSLVDADTAFVNFENNQMLTISTCNTFGEKQERWVVEAELTN